MSKKPKSNGYDFAGYATKANVKCTDGRVISSRAFVSQDGTRVPLVWAHLHGELENFLGHADIEARSDGMYVKARFNNTEKAKIAKELIAHGDITSLSIYANHIKQVANKVIHGEIKEVSLVMAPANPGAVIETISIAHADGSEYESDDELIFYDTSNEISLAVEHSDEEDEDPIIEMSDTDTVKEIIETMTPEQKAVLFGLVSEAAGEDDGEDAEHSDNEEGEKSVKYNAFNKDLKHSDTLNGSDAGQNGKTLTHAEEVAFIEEAKRAGKWSAAVIAHAEDYGITNIEELFPDFKVLNNVPAWVKRDTEWVDSFLSGTSKIPFARFKTLTADITADEARAKGYIKGNRKEEEFFSVAHRETGPTTVYKKQKFDNDDLIDLTSFDVVNWVKGEMGFMLREELARAMLLGDGRPAGDKDKINENCIRPIAKEDDLYAPKIDLQSAADDYEGFIDEVILAMMQYKGKGSPNLYTTKQLLTRLRLIKDKLGYRLFKNDSEIASELRVNKIIEVEVMENYAVDTNSIVGVIVNPNDYTVGMNPKGKIQNYYDFDIDFNQHKYLTETRLSGALREFNRALVLRRPKSSGASTFSARNKQPVGTL